jgi:hypothetical protein
VAKSTSEYPVPSNGVGQWLTVVATSQSELGRFIEDFFTRVSGLLAEFSRHQRAWELDRSRAERDLRARSDDLTRREIELGAQRERPRETLPAATVPVPTPPAASPPLQEELIRRMIAEMQQERETLRTALSTAQSQVGGWGQATAELAKARDAFLHRSDRDACDGPPDHADSHRSLDSRMRRSNDELAQLERERDALERELEIVHRAAALSEMLSQQGQQMVQQREQWSDEIKRVGSLLESAAQRQLTQPAAK